MATLVAPKHNITEPIIAKATTALWPVLFTRELGLQKVELEGDPLQVVQAMRNEKKNWCRYDQLINDARVVLNCLQN